MNVNSKYMYNTHLMLVKLILILKTIYHTIRKEKINFNQPTPQWGFSRANGNKFLSTGHILCHLYSQNIKNRYPKSTCVGYNSCINGHEPMAIVWDTTSIPHNKSRQNIYSFRKALFVCLFVCFFFGGGGLFCFVFFPINIIHPRTEHVFAYFSATFRRSDSKRRLHSRVSRAFLFSNLWLSLIS